MSHNNEVLRLPIFGIKGVVFPTISEHMALPKDIAILGMREHVVAVSRLDQEPKNSHRLFDRLDRVNALLGHDDPKKNQHGRLWFVFDSNSGPRKIKDMTRAVGTINNRSFSPYLDTIEIEGLGTLLDMAVANTNDKPSDMSVVNLDVPQISGIRALAKIVTGGPGTLKGTLNLTLPH